MLTAKEAREIAQDSHSVISEQFREIEKMIYEAAMDGECGIIINYNPHLYVKRYLENRGYGVRCISDSDEIYDITW